MFYLLAESEKLPETLLNNEGVNKRLTIFSRAAPDLLTYLHEYCIYPSDSDTTVVQALELASPPPLASDAEHSGTGVLGRPGRLEDVLHFNSLVLETTYFCNARCSHCYTRCGPERSYKVRMPVAAAKRVISQAASISCVQNRCHIGGGEARIFWDELREMLRYAADLGFRNSIVTNGFWATRESEADRKVSELVAAGVEIIEISADAMHQEFISTDAVTNLIRAAQARGVAITLRVSTTKTRRAGEVVIELPAENQRDIAIACCKVTPHGRAAYEIPGDDIWVEEGIPVGSCHSALNLNVTPSGDVFPCCAGSETCPPLALGNAFETSLSQVLSSLRWSFLVRTLVHAGPAYFAALLKEAGPGAGLLSGYSSYCHLCTHIFSTPHLAHAARQAVEERVSTLLRAAALRLTADRKSTHRAHCSRPPSFSRHIFQ
ncbi:MAG: radical SAM/SPASM domain-containing protein [Planctomycetota bacterium]|jgi:organic radical activating enzyme